MLIEMGKYVLSEKVAEGGAETYLGYEKDNQRVVLLHRLSDASNPKRQAQLVARALQRQLQQRESGKSGVLDVLEWEGDVCIVTEHSAAAMNLESWLQGEAAGTGSAPATRTAREVVDATPVDLGSLPQTLPDSAGKESPERRADLDETVVLPAPPRQPPPGQQPSAPTAEPAAGQSEAGDFTRMFVTPEARKKEPPPPAGDFTRMFQASGQPETSPREAERLAAEPPSETTQPGDFTRLFQAGKLEQLPPEPAAEKPAGEPSAHPPPAGEFTQLFQAGEKIEPEQRPATPPPAQRDSSPPKDAQAGEFTQMFQATERSVTPLPDTKDRPGATQSQIPAGPGSEFTRIFQATERRIVPGKTPETRPPEPSPVSGQEAGEFTQMFQGGNAPPKREPPPSPEFREPQPPPPETPDGEFTQMFETPDFGARSSRSPDRAPRADSDEEESFTRYLHGQAKGEAGLAGPAPKEGEYTQMFGGGAKRPAREEPPAEEAGEATALFQAPSRKPAQAEDPGPSEFTRMIKAEPVLPPEDQKPEENAYPADEEKGNSLPFIILFSVLGVLAIIVVVVVLVRN